MSDYFIYYTESSIVCLIIFSIILFHDITRVDRQEKQIKFDYALIAFMLYFITDAFWAGIISGVLPKTLNSVRIINFLLFLSMALITYLWFMYVLAVEKVKKRHLPLQQFAMSFPLIVSSVIALIIYAFFPSLMIDDSLDTTVSSTVMQIIVPIIYIVAILLYTVKQASKTSNPDERREHLYVGILPLAIVLGGILQVALLQKVPVFCFCCAIVMIVFYIQSIESRVSIDPLTGLNNRGQLMRYVSQDANMHRSGLRTCVIMLDVNDFKLINDGYGHAEGDHALVIIAQSLKKAIGSAGMPLFLARYGGDEFILIVHPGEKQSPEAVIKKIRSCLKAECAEAGIPYTISLGAGCSEMAEENDTFQKCLERADQKLYIDKESNKRGA